MVAAAVLKGQQAGELEMDIVGKPAADLTAVVFWITWNT